MRALARYALPAAVTKNKDIGISIVVLDALPVNGTDQVQCEPDDGGVAEFLDDEFVGEDAVDERGVVAMKRRVPVVFELNEDLLVGADRRRLRTAVRWAA